MKKTPIIFLLMLFVVTSCDHKQQSGLNNNTQNETIVQEETPIAEPEEKTFTWLSERLVTEDDLAGLDAEELRILRNAIFAVHGYKFKSSELQEYFSKFSWYEPLSNDVSGMMNSIEQKMWSSSKPMSLQWDIAIRTRTRYHPLAEMSALMNICVHTRNMLTSTFLF